MYYGGGGQGNHLGGVYGSATLKALGVRFRANAISQEKTGEVLVMGKMFGTPLRGDFEHCEVAFFVGKNPWISHGIPARTTLKAIAADPDRAMIVIDPRVTETAAMADFHLQVRSGQRVAHRRHGRRARRRGLVDRDWLGRHASGRRAVLAALGRCRSPGTARSAASTRPVRAPRRIAAAAERRGVRGPRRADEPPLDARQLPREARVAAHRNLAPGGQYAMSSIGNLLRMSPPSSIEHRSGVAGRRSTSSVGSSRATSWPRRSSPITRTAIEAMIVESGNPLHSVADSQRMREAMRTLDVSVCIDVFMTETARQSDYVLPATTQYEKFEATFFNFDFPKNVFQLRRPVLDPPDGPLPEPRSTPDSSRRSASSTTRSTSCTRPRHEAATTSRPRSRRR